MSFSLRGPHGPGALPPNFESGQMNGPAAALSNCRRSDTSKGRRGESFRPDTFASSHQAALPALILTERRHQSRSRPFDPRRVGEDQLGVLLAPRSAGLLFQDPVAAISSATGRGNTRDFRNVFMDLISSGENGPSPGLGEPSRGLYKTSPYNLTIKAKIHRRSCLTRSGCQTPPSFPHRPGDSTPDPDDVPSLQA